MISARWPSSCRQSAIFHCVICLLEEGTGGGFSSFHVAVRVQNRGDENQTKETGTKVPSRQDNETQMEQVTVAFSENPQRNVHKWPQRLEKWLRNKPEGHFATLTTDLVV